MPDKIEAAAAGFRRYRRPALIAGIVFSVLAAVGAVADVQAFLHAYLMAYFYWLGISLGCLATLMIQNLTGGNWGAVIRRFLEAGASLVLPLAVLFIPVLVGIPALYAWSRPGGFPPVTQPAFKQFYLSLPFFIGRAVFYFAVWIILSRLLTRWSLARDRTGDPGLTARMRGLSAAGLVLFALTVTFAAIDWLMSLEAAWYSSIYGAMVAMGTLLTGFAFAIALTTWFADREPFDRVVTPNLLNSLGSLLLAFLMLWAYLAFSQFLLMYAGNLPDELTWYVRRVQGPWLGVALFVAVVHFALPFCVLIIRDFKRTRWLLGVTALVLVLAHYVDVYWIVKPAFAGAGSGLHWLDVVAPIALGGLWLAAFSWQISRWPLLARHDPRLVEKLEIAHEQG